MDYRVPIWKLVNHKKYRATVVPRGREKSDKKLWPWSKPNSITYSGVIDPEDMLVVVCSAVDNFGARAAIGNSWGRETAALPRSGLYISGEHLKEPTPIQGLKTYATSYKVRKHYTNSFFRKTVLTPALKSLALLQYVSKSCQDSSEGRECPDFHQLGPTGPSWSTSRHVRVCVCVSVCAIAKHPLPEVV